MPNWTSNRIEAPAEVLKKYVKMSDLIRREAALNQITAIDTSIIPYAKAREYVDELKNYVIKIIEALPSAEPERKWIPVTERLPKDNRQVLVYAQSVHYALAKYDEMMEPDGEWKKQWVTFDAWKPYHTINNVIAWMPLPEAWKGE